MTRLTHWRTLAVACLGIVMMLGFLHAAPAMAGTDGQSAHDFSFTAIDGAPLPMTDFRGKAVLVVNTASFCGFTGQYEALQALYDRFQDRGLVVLGVPSNDFGRQEPGSADEIKEFCEVNYQITFPLTEKQVVSGSDAHPFYRWAGDQVGTMGKPRWNFHKYLVGPDGELVDWFSTVTKPNSSKVVSAIEAVLPN
ncbi:MAG: glutathione peroxidase [Alphaproteobacteria bacterium]|nr:glutathione peroxidase [Alphaproteobacteria bacterium]